MNNNQIKPKIRLWIFNHPIKYITEQIDFILIAFRLNGYDITVSNKPSITDLNLIIENFNAENLSHVKSFAQKYSKRIGVIMTEHIDIVHGKIFFHGEDIDEKTKYDYMPSITMRSRLMHLLAFKNNIKCFFRLGDLPILRGISSSLCDVPVITIPYPRITSRERSLELSTTYDLAFSGVITSYRLKILRSLSTEFKVAFYDTHVSRRARDLLNSSAKFVINIPQNFDWPWISSMRVIAAWRCGRPVINIGNATIGLLSDYCINLNNFDGDLNRVREILGSSMNIFSSQLSAYNSFADSSLNEQFPHSYFFAWGLLELNNIHYNFYE